MSPLLLRNTPICLRARSVSVAGSYRRSLASVAPSATSRSSTHTSPSPAPRKPKQEGDISSVFASLSGEQAVTLPRRFSDLKKTIVPTLEAQDRLIESWKDLLQAVSVGIDEIKRRGTEIIPEVPYAAVRKDLEGDSAWKSEVKKRGVVVVRDVVDDELALSWKESVRDYAKMNPQVKGFPADNKQVFEIYWSTAQLQARSHPDMLQAQKALLKLFHAKPTDAVSLDTPISYVDRLRIRQPGDAKFALGPHIDGGSLERWEDPIYRGCYQEILQGRWREHDAFDIGRRLGANSDIYGGPGQGAVQRAWQGWLALSTTGPGEGTLRTFPLLKEATAYVLLRPFFRPTLPPSSPDFLSASTWVLDLESTDFPASAMGRGQELNAISHPHLQLETSPGGMVSMKRVNPGDMVFWHCDGIHAVESTHNGTGDSSVFYIPSSPLTVNNVGYLAAQRETFAGGVPPPDFPGGVGEKGFKSLGKPSDIIGDAGLKAMGLKKFTPWEGISEGQLSLIKESNRILGF